MSQEQKGFKREQPLKLAPLLILRVLERWSNSENPMSEAKIAKEVERDFGLTLERKTVSNNLAMLAGIDQRIVRLTKERSDGKGGTQEVSIGWYCDSYFEQSELQLLADALICTGRIPQRQKRDLFEKLHALGGGFKISGLDNIYSANPKVLENKQIFRTIDVLSEALTAGSCVQFKLGSFDVNGALSAQEKKLYIVEPLFMAVSNGRYYLVAKYSHYDSFAHFRVDLMLDANVCRDEKGKLLQAQTRALKRPAVQKYIDEHLYMYTDASSTIVFRIPDIPLARHHVFDYFGSSAHFNPSKEVAKHLDVTVQSNEKAMRYWAMQFSDIVEVLKPESLRDDIQDAARRVIETYKD